MGDPPKPESWWLGKIQRGLAKSPSYVAARLLQEVLAQTERYRAPLRSRRLTAEVLARREGHASVSDWWRALAERPWFAGITVTREDVERICPGESERILAGAELAMARRVNLLGSGMIELGSSFDWHCDYKTGFRWPNRYCRDIEYNNAGSPSDVKFPWELSRMQWMIPLGQAYILTRDEKYAVAMRDLLLHWIERNPVAFSVNWSCTMEAALRIITWTWFFHAFKNSEAWRSPEFQSAFLRALYLHADFTSRNLEKSDINGNHYTADAAGLVFAGCFFGARGAGAKWHETGWDILCDEFPRQVFDDGVDFEASVPYHRLVLELFLLPALYRDRIGLDIPESYRRRLVSMAEFTSAYTRVDGTSPLWGDADDARTLPLGGQALGDHRYLLGLVGLAFSERDLVDAFSGSRAESLWLLGAEVAKSLPDRAERGDVQEARAFPLGGFYVLRNSRDHVFVDCGPLGLGGRGGHGHNDLLSFEAVLDSVHLVSDCGAYLYTADYHARNLFRSTGYHNTPKLDDQEINRFQRWDYLWTFENDASHQLQELKFLPSADKIVMRHTGYGRLASPVTVVRDIELHHARHELCVSDRFEGAGEHAVEIPLHFAFGVSVEMSDENVRLVSSRRVFELIWGQRSDWNVSLEAARISPSYGIAYPSLKLVWRRHGPLRALRVTIRPAPASPS